VNPIELKPLEMRVNVLEQLDYYVKLILELNLFIVINVDGVKVDQKVVHYIVSIM